MHLSEALTVQCRSLFKPHKDPPGRKKKPKKKKGFCDFRFLVRYEGSRLSRDQQGSRGRLELLVTSVPLQWKLCVLIWIIKACICQRMGRRVAAEGITDEENHPQHFTVIIHFQCVLRFFSSTPPIQATGAGGYLRGYSEPALHISTSCNLIIYLFFKHIFTRFGRNTIKRSLVL